MPFYRQTMFNRNAMKLASIKLQKKDSRGEGTTWGDYCNGKHRNFMHPRRTPAPLGTWSNRTTKFPHNPNYHTTASGMHGVQLYAQHLARHLMKQNTCFPFALQAGMCPQNKHPAHCRHANIRGINVLTLWLHKYVSIVFCSHLEMFSGSASRMLAYFPIKLFRLG